MRTNRPPHKLLQVFPVETPKHDLASTSRPREDENAFIRFDPAVEPLFELLSFIKTKHDSSIAESNNDEYGFLILPTQQPQEIDNDESSL